MPNGCQRQDGELQAGARERQGMDWSGQGEGLDKGLTQGTMLMVLYGLHGL